MADTVTITLAGNLRHAVRITQRDGIDIARTEVCMAHRHIHRGILVDSTLCLAVEVRGTAEAHAFAAANRTGSRVVLQGHLEERHVTSTQQLPAADGRGAVAVLVEQHTLVVVVDTILADGATIGADNSPQREATPHACPKRDGDTATKAEPSRQARHWQWTHSQE